MKSKRTQCSVYHPRRTQVAAFTLIEILIVVGLMAVIVSAGMAVSFDSYRGYLFRAEYTNIAHVLATARNRAANNFSESAHGVAFKNNEYRLFAEEEYDDSDPDTYKSFPRNDEITVTGATKIVFEQLSGNVDTCDSTPCMISFDGGGVRQQTITINEAGGITW